jgi:TonB family protein
MMVYRACALFVSLAAVTFGALLFSPPTGAGYVGHAVLMQFAQGAGASELEATQPGTNPRTRMNSVAGRNPANDSGYAQALSGKPLGSKKAGSDGGGAQPVPGGTSLTSPAEGTPGGGEGGAGGNGEGAGQGGNGQSANDGAGNGGESGGESAGGKAGPPVDERELADILAGYHSRIVGLIKAQKQYPQIARRLGHQGIVRLSFTLSSSGELTSSSVDRSSGFPELDSAALNAVKAVNRFPAFPTQLGPSPRAFIVSLSFTLD